MFDRPHHQRIATLLTGMKAEVLKEHGCLFGGGTAIALSHGEYRQSIDIDFICDSVDGYRGLRSLVNQSGLTWAFDAPVTFVREPRVDQYGIRTAINVDGTPIKWEVVYEGRIQLDPPREADQICGTWRLTDTDLIATKLMANADRWADDAVMSRDMIDLAMLAPKGQLAHAGVKKAERAYGTSVADAFRKAKAALLDRPGRLRLCMSAMHMVMPEGKLRAALDRLQLEKSSAPTLPPTPAAS